MLNFASWLAKQSNKDPMIKALQEFASANDNRWPVDSDTIHDYRTAISSAGGPSRDDLLTALGQLYERWLNQGRRTFWAQLGDHAGSMALFIGGLIIAGGLAYGIFVNKAFFDLMAQSDHARGLITFLFSFATIAIIILVSVAVFWMDKAEVEARFAHAKDLISILVGVLGTIIGFYFGTASNSGLAPQRSAMTVTPYSATLEQKLATPQDPVYEANFRRVWEPRN
jgi:hypothetical protein